eukprot:4989668-Prymnesium_polylepis.2
MATQYTITARGERCRRVIDRIYWVNNECKQDDQLNAPNRLIGPAGSEPPETYREWHRKPLGSVEYNATSSAGGSDSGVEYSATGSAHGNEGSIDSGCSTRGNAHNSVGGNSCAPIVWNSGNEQQQAQTSNDANW